MNKLYTTRSRSFTTKRKKFHFSFNSITPLSTKSLTGRKLIWIRSKKALKTIRNVCRQITSNVWLWFITSQNKDHRWSVATTFVKFHLCWMSLSQTCVVTCQSDKSRIRNSIKFWTQHAITFQTICRQLYSREIHWNLSKIILKRWVNALTFPFSNTKNSISLKTAF